MKMKLGIDEVGRGAWAGPLVVGAVVLGDAQIDGLTDSKKLSAKRRQELAYKIKSRARAVATGWVSSAEVDQWGLSRALKVAAARAVAKIDCSYDEIVIDGTIRLLDDERVVTMPRADALVACVSAASIVAKVARDMYMVKLGQKYPGYGFEKHMGYGTAAHCAALEQLGPMDEHRRSFAPIKTYFPDLTGRKSELRACSKSHTTGQRAEAAAAEFLTSRGHDIISRNWKCKICEIDLVSRRDEEIYFTEVKYRRSVRAGDGVEAIDVQKERQMRFAAEVYLEYNEPARQLQPILSVVALSGDPPTVETYIPDIEGH
jgi:ribonuclease HII